MPVKKSSLTPTKYDEVSLVDVGAAEDALVLIMKSDLSKRFTPPNLKNKSASSPKKKQSAPSEYRSGKYTMSGLIGMGEAAEAAKKKKKKGGKDTSESSSESGSTKRKKGTTERAQNWDEEKHPRAEPGSAAPNSGGTFGTTSSESKKKYGKGGTTAASQKRDGGGKSKSSISVKNGDTLWALAEKHLGDGNRWKELGKQIGITTDAQARKMQIGSKINIPGSDDNDSEGGSSRKRDSRRKSRGGKRTSSSDRPVNFNRIKARKKAARDKKISDRSVNYNRIQERKKIARQNKIASKKIAIKPKLRPPSIKPKPLKKVASKLSSPQRVSQLSDYLRGSQNKNPWPKQKITRSRWASVKKNEDNLLVQWMEGKAT